MYRSVTTPLDLAAAGLAPTPVNRRPKTVLLMTTAATLVGLELPTDDAASSTRWSPWRSYVSHHLWAVALDELDDRARAKGIPT